MQYEDDISAKIALREAQHAVLNGRTIRCEPARVNRTLFISNRYAVTEKVCLKSIILKLLLCLSTILTKKCVSPIKFI